MIDPDDLAKEGELVAADMAARKPTLDMDFSDPGPFKPNFVHDTTDGYRIIDGKPVRWTA